MRFLILLVAVVALPTVATASDTELGVGIGLFDTAAWFDDKGDFDAVEGGIEVRWPTTLPFGIGPIAGLSVTEESAFWAYLGGRRPVALGGGWSLALSFAFSYYEQGNGKDLGHEIEFRSGIDLARRLASGAGLGVELYHLSNAGISDVNPGSNSLRVIYTVPIGR